MIDDDTWKVFLVDMVSVLRYDAPDVKPWSGCNKTDHLSTLLSPRAELHVLLWATNIFSGMILSAFVLCGLRSNGIGHSNYEYNKLRRNLCLSELSQRISIKFWIGHLSRPRKCSLLSPRSTFRLQQQRKNVQLKRKSNRKLKITT